jgi:hypothetical protein
VSYGQLAVKKRPKVMLIAETLPETKIVTQTKFVITLVKADCGTAICAIRPYMLPGDTRLHWPLQRQVIGIICQQVYCRSA